MTAKKITKDTIINLIEDEAYVIKRKSELFSELKKMNEEIKNLNECRGIVGTFGFKEPSDSMNKSANGTGFKNPQNISYVSQLEKEMGGFGDESNNEINEIEAIKQENEQLKKQMAEFSSLTEGKTPEELEELWSGLKAIGQKVGQAVSNKAQAVGQAVGQKVGQATQAVGQAAQNVKSTYQAAEQKTKVASLQKQLQLKQQELKNIQTQLQQATQTA